MQSQSREDPELPGEQRRGERARGRLALGWFAITLPVLSFFVLVSRWAVNLPHMDDYDAMLEFLNRFVTTRTAAGRFSYFLASEHVQYKLYFEHLLLLVEWKLTGHIDFLVLQQVGNAFVLLFTLVLWRMFQPVTRSFADKLLLFTPVVLLLFAPRYSETLNWAMGSLQNLTVIFFSLLCPHLLIGNRKNGFAGACLSMVLAICCSGNGFLLAGVALLFLMHQRAWRRVWVWTAILAFMTGLYAYQYTLSFSPSPEVINHPLRVTCLFPLAFLGAASSRLVFSLMTGAAIVCLALLLIRLRWRTTAPQTFYSSLFILATGLGVDLTRHILGLYAALSSRYAIYSQILLALLYMTALQFGFERRLNTGWRRFALGSVFVLAGLYFIWSGRLAARDLENRSQLLQTHYQGWVRSPGQVSLVPDEDPRMRLPPMVTFRTSAEQTLLQSEALGVYRPPARLR